MFKIVKFIIKVNIIWIYGNCCVPEDKWNVSVNK